VIGALTGSFMSSRVERRPAVGVGCTSLERTGRELKGKMIVAMMRVTGGRPLVRSLALARLAPGEGTEGK
jgi:hypothetical protein